ncbi:hypothetical protein INF35_05905 [Subdoligranulum sp. DSM 109015]|uniref:DNA-binding protein n=1 Tax=Gemmiger gallinarum TaxID=2779354 RepID=A0ABR9R2E1_9FIRM|nr:hypothetical protein [Gemmiger gallinarum]MBE5037309.1 hypothetical protein [Gemmiger gallinarum]
MTNNPEVELQMNDLRQLGLKEWPTLNEVSKVTGRSAKSLNVLPIWQEEIKGGRTFRRTTLRRLARYMVTGR